MECKKMEKGYTCKCGNDEWFIFTGKIKCTKCNEIYNVFSSSHFNIEYGIYSVNSARDEEDQSMHEKTER
jgi:hypothetical protein